MMMTMTMMMMMTMMIMMIMMIVKKMIMNDDNDETISLIGSGSRDQILYPFDATFKNELPSYLGQPIKFLRK